MGVFERGTAWARRRYLKLFLSGIVLPSVVLQRRGVLSFFASVASVGCGKLGASGFERRWFEPRG
jgi:hypothetical protein